MPHAALLTLALLAAGTARGAGTLIIALRPEATVDADRVLLADVASVTGEPRRLALRLAALDLGPAPPLHLPRIFSRTFLAERLRRERFDPHTIAWTGTEETRVTCRTTLLPGSLLAQEAVAQAQRALPCLGGGTGPVGRAYLHTLRDTPSLHEQAAIEVADPPADLWVAGPPDGLHTLVSLAPGGAASGLVPARVIVLREGRPLAQATVLLRVSPRPPQTFARRPDATSHREQP